MIARFCILLPFELFITEAAEWPSVELTSADYKITVYPPMLVAERPKPVTALVPVTLRVQNNVIAVVVSRAMAAR